MCATRRFLKTRTQTGSDGVFAPQEVAAAALMVECARIDGEATPEEREAVCRAVREELALDAEVADGLVELAELREDEVWHDWLFIETLRTSFEEDEKLGVIRRLWQVAYADGTVHPLEERLIARIARELGISELGIAQSRQPMESSHP